MPLINFDVPDELLEEFDETIKGKYQSRAEAFRSLMRQFIDDKEKEASTDAASDS